MKLSEKGPLAPAPTLEATLEPVPRVVQSWPDVIAATHWDLFQVGKVVDGIDFYVGDDELGHIHLDGEAHFATGIALAQALVSGGFARPLRWGGAGWVEYSVRTTADAAHAAWLFELNYQRLRGQPEAELVATIAARQNRQAL